LPLYKKDNKMAYEQYKDRNIGRLMYYLYKYNHQTDSCIFESNDKYPMVTLYGKPFANYTWDEGTNIPTFEFLGEYDFLNRIQEQQKPRIIEWDQNKLTDGVCKVCNYGYMLRDYKEFNLCNCCANILYRKIRLKKEIMEKKIKNI
jgi:hypothetical protein